MGTSQSSKGPGSGVSMVPSWVDDPPAEAPTGDDPAPEEDPAAPPAAPPAPPPAAPVAPDRRWIGVSRSLGDYAKTGDTGAMRRGFGHYVRSGYGGAGTASRRMGGTAATAGALGSALASLAGGQPAAPESCQVGFLACSSGSRASCLGFSLIGAVGGSGRPDGLEI